jgi:hypothetical protein
MKILHASMGVMALILLQACSDKPTKATVSQTAPSQTVAGKSDTAKVHLINTSRTKNTDGKLSVPEAQIIRELYNSGCLIEEIELNRRKQQMKITCVNDAPYSSSI